MERPAISIIIPVLNTKSWLQQCMDSVVGQTLKSIEIICVDNGSTDGSLEMLNEYARIHANVTVLQCPREGRLGGARNAGMKVARGEFIGFVDSDDWVEPKMFEKLYSAVIDTKAELAVCNTTYFYQQDGHRVNALPLERLERDSGFDITQRPKLLRNITTWNKLYSAVLLTRLALWFPEGFYHEDHFFVVIAFFRARKIVACPESLYIYRKQRQGSIGLYRGADNLHVFTVLDQAQDVLLKQGLDDIHARLLQEFRVSRILGLVGATDGQVRKTYYQKMQQEFRGLDLSNSPQILSPTELREFRVVRRCGYLQYRMFVALRWHYSRARALLGLGRRKAVVGTAMTPGNG